MLIVPQVRQDWPDLVNSGQQGVDAAAKWAQGPPLNLGSASVDELIDKGAQQAQGSVSSIAEWALSSLGVLGGVLTTMVLTLVASFMMRKMVRGSCPGCGAGAARGCTVMPSNWVTGCSRPSAPIFRPKRWCR